MAQFVTHIQPTLVEASHHHVPHQHHHKELHHHHKEYHETIDHHHKEHKDHKDHKDSHHHHKDSSHHHLRDFPVLPHPHVEHSPHNGHDDVDHKSKRDSGQYLDSHGVSHTFQLHFVDSQGIYRDYHGHAIDKDSEGRHKKEKSPFKDEAKAIPPQYIDLGGHYLDNKNTDGNTSFLRAARNGQLEKVLEHLESNIDINTSNANGLNALHLASKDGHVEIVKELLKRGAVIDAATKKGNTALHIASLAGQEEVVKLLVSHGASVNVQSQNGFTPLYMAAQENHDNVVKYLLANGANQSLSTEDGFTPLAVAMQQGHDKVVTVLLENDTRGKVRLPALHIAAKKDDVKAAKLLLENEHNPDVTSKSGFTPLHIASHYGNQAIANLLLQKGADVNYAAKHNITPLHVAAKWGKTNMVTVLLEHGANIESKTRDGLTPLHCAARSGHEQVVDMLLEKGAPISSKTKNGLAPLHMAAQGDHVDAARILLYHRAPVDEVTVDYLTALHVAAHCGHVRVAKLLLDRQADANARALNGFTPLHIACKKNRIKVVELLLKHGASIGATTESGLTPLHVASFMGCMNIVIYLLQHDASPDVPTVRGETPLHLAARANQTDIIRILLRNGAQVDARAREQQTPLHIASRLGNVDIVMLLLQHGAKVDNTTKDMYTALHIAAKEGQDEVAAALIDHGASLNATTKKGFTPLHLAAKYGHLKVAKLLLQKEAPVDAQGKNGVTPLHVASHYDHQNVALLLLEKGASPYATAKNGHTPLHIAAKKNQMDIANTLLEYGAKPNAESKAGFTPLHLSAQEGHCDMTDLLIEHKADTNHRARNGLAPLHLCAQEDKVPVAEILVKNGGEVDASTKNGYTPLHIACHYGQINMVRFLLSHGANVKANTALGYTPLHQAAQQGHTNIVNTLLENSAQPNAVTNNGQTPLHIAEKLGYITVIDTLKVVTQPSSPMSASTISNEEKYRVVAPEAMHETFMSDSEEEGAGENILDGFGTAPHQRHVYLPYFNGTTLLTREDTVLGDQTYRYLTADEMKSLGDDSLPIDVTRDERIDSNKMASNAENMMPPRHIEDNISPEHVQQNYVEYIKKYTPDNIDIDKHPINIGKLHWKNFLVSFLVDARGGAMRGCRHSGVRVIVPPRCASSPTRITCRYVRPQRTPHPPPLMEGEALASRVLELGPVGAKFLGPVIIEVPHFAALRGKEREIVILRSDNGESWKEHTVDATEEVLNEVLHDSFEAEDLNQLEDVSSGRITRIVTQDFPQYFAVVSRIRQEVHAIGPEGGMVSSTVVPQVQAVFPQGALTKKIKVGLQAQPIDPELTAKLLGHGVAVSPVVTVEPRRRKFHKAITLSMPAPRAHSQGMINQYSGSAPTLRLLCSITGGTTRAQWEDVTGSTPLTFVNDCVSFTTTVSARFWLMDCRNVGDATKMATELYREAIHVPFMAKFVVFAKRVDPLEARLRVFCMTDDKEDKTLEHQEHFTEVAKSRDVEVLEGKPQYIEFAGNLVPITKSGEQLQFSFRAFRENRLPFSVRVKDQHAEAVSRCLFMREPKLPKGEPPQQPICILNIVLPDDIVVDTISLTDSDSLKKIENFDYYRPDPRLADMSNLLGEDWVPLATQLGLTTSEINVIKSEYPDSVAKQAQSMLRMWLSQSGNKAQTNTLESALRRIGREDIIPQCLNVEYPAHGIKEIGKQRLIKKISIEQNLYERDIMRDSESVESLKKAEEERKKENFDKYSAEEKVVEETSDEEDFNKTVTERRQQIEERLSVDRTVPASSQRVEIVQEISSIKRQSLVENKIAEVEQKAVTEVVDGKTTKTSNELTTPLTAEKTKVDGERERRDSALLEGVTQRFESTKTMMTKIASTEDPKSPKVSKTPPPSPADFLTREQAASIQEWDVSKKSASQEEAPQDAEQQGLSTTTERLVARHEETLLDKPLGQQLTGLSVTDDYLLSDLKTVLEQTNAFIQSESQPEPYDALAEKYTRKEPINERKVDDHKNNMNEKKKAKKGFFGSIKTFVERSFESDSESEKSPKKSKKPKKEKKKKAKDEKATEQGLPPRKPKLPTPPLAPSDIDSIPFVEASVSDLPPPYKPPDVPIKEEQIPVTDLDADLPVQEKEQTPQPTETKEKVQEKLQKDKDKKKSKAKTVVVEEVTKTIQPLVIEAEEFSVVVDPTKKESPKKSKETFTINIDETIEKKEKEILERSPILSEEKIMKPIAALEQIDVPVRPPRTKDHIYEDIEDPAKISQVAIKEVTTSLIQNEMNNGAWSDITPVTQKTEKEDEAQKEIVEKQDKEILKETDKKKDEKKSGFFGLFKKRDSKKDDEVPILEKVEKKSLSEEVLKDMDDSKKFISDEVDNYHDVRPVAAKESEPEIVSTIAKPETEKTKVEEVEERKIEETKAQSEGFFGLFKKPKKEEKPADKKDVEKKTKKEEKKQEEKKLAVILSEEVLKNILDSKRFLEGEVQNYHDVRTDQAKVQEKVVEVVHEEPPKKIIEEPSPKKVTDVRRESSPKPSGLFGLFKKSKDAEVEQPAKEMKETEQILTAEIEKPEEPKLEPEEKKIEEVEKTTTEAAETQSSGFFGFFKKSKKEEEAPPAQPQLSESVVKDITDTTQFLTDEVQHYEDTRPVKEETLGEEKATESAEQPSSGFFGLFKKAKKEDEKIAPETVTKEISVEEKPVKVPTEEEKAKKVVEEARESSPKPGFFGLFKKSKKDEEETIPTRPPLSDSVLKDIKETNQFLSCEIENYHDVKPVKFAPIVGEKIEKSLDETVESSPKSSRGLFGIFKKSKKDQEEIPEAKKPVLSEAALKDMNDTRSFLQTEVDNYQDVKPAKFQPIKEEKVDEDIEEPQELSPKSRGLFGIFKKPKKDREGSVEAKLVLSEEVLKDMKDTDEFLSVEVDNYHDVKIPEEQKPIQAAEINVESAAKPSKGLFGIFKKSKKDEEETAELKLSDSVEKEVIKEETEKHTETKPEKSLSTDEEKISKTVKESSPSRGLFGIFKKPTKEEEITEPKPVISEEVAKDIADTNKFLTGEVENYHDVKPEKSASIDEEKVIKTVEERTESSPSRGLFGIFKKPKKDEEPSETKVELSEEVVRDINDTTQFLTEEVKKYHDVKPEKRASVDEEKAIKTVGERTESSPSRGLFGIFKKGKKDEEHSESKTALSEEVVKDISDTTQFLTEEVEKYQDVKHEKSASVDEEKVPKTVDEKTESSPSRGLFGIFKKPKKDEGPSETKVALSEEVVKDINDTTQFLSEEVEKYHDVRAEKRASVDEEKVTKAVEERTESSPSRGLFGIFKKSKKDEELSESKIPLSEDVVKDINDTTQFLTEEVEKYHDVKPEKSASVDEEKVTKTVEERTESSPARGLFGIFKKTKKDEETLEPKPTLSEEAKDIVDTTQVLTEEVQKYQDVKPEETILTEKVQKAGEDKSESRGVFGFFKKSKREGSVEHKGPLSEEVVKDMADTSKFLSTEVENYHDVKPETTVKDIEEPKTVTVEDEQVPKSTEKRTESRGLLGIFKKSKKEEEISDVKTIEKDTQATQESISSEVTTYEDAILEFNEAQKMAPQDDDEPKQEAKVGFLSKFKKTKKKPSLTDPQLSEEVLKQMDETKNFLSTELENYEDATVQRVDKDKKDEKTVTFEDTKSKMVTEIQLPQVEVAHVVEVATKDAADLASETVEELQKTTEVVEKQVTKVQQVAEEEVKPLKKDKYGKEKKGKKFNIFGKKSKSQDASFDEGRGRTEEESEGSPKKQKRRKSSSPFKFFEKMMKSEEEVKETEPEEPQIPAKIATVTKEEPKDDLLAIEFEKEAGMNLSEEVLGSLEKKMEELKKKYSPEVQKQINDCRDFLFIEVDNYEDSKPVVVTDIDTGISTDASKAVDEIIDEAAKAVQVGQSQATTVKSEVVETITRSDSESEDGKKKEKKKDKKSGGFFSKLGSLISGSVDEAKSEIEEAKKGTQETLDSTVKSVKGKAEKTKDALAEKTIEKTQEIKDLKDSSVATTSQKVDEAKKGIMELKESLLETTEKTGKKIEDIKKDTSAKTGEIKDAAVKTVDDVKGSAQTALTKATDQVVEASVKKMEEVKQTTEETKNKTEETVKTVLDSGVSKLDDLQKKTKEKLADGKSRVEQKMDEAVKESSKIVKELEKTKDYAVEKTEDAKTQGQQITQQVVETTKDVKRDAEKAKAYIESVGKQKVDDLDKAIEDMRAKIDEEVKDFQHSTQQKADDLAQVKDKAVKDVEMAAKKKIDEMEQTKELVKGAIEEKVDDFGKTAGQAMNGFGKVKESSTQAAAQKIEELSQVKEKAVAKLDEVKDEIAVAAKGKMDDMAQKSSKFVDDLAKVKEEAQEKITQKIDAKAKDIKDAVSQKIVDVDKTDKISKTVTKKVEDLTEEAVNGFQKTTQILSKVDKTKEDAIADLSKLKDSASGTLSQLVTDTAKSKESAIEDLMRIEQSLKDTSSQIAGELSKGVSQKVDDFQAARQKAIDDIEKIKSSTKADAAIKKEVDQKKKKLDEELSKLTSSLEQLAEPVVKDIETVKSYVTSPTMARRAESQRFSREERPTVREVKTGQQDEDSDEEHYTVTEPEDEDDKKRKPLFHLESEDDDSFELSKAKERRDSVKSNVLETLSENKLDNLLSDLESQLVKDLDRSVTEVKEKSDSKLAKVELELETITKDSQADVDQIEQKLRDLDKALDSLEQASDPKLEKKLHRVERKFERMASEVMDKDVTGASPTEVEARREHEFQKLVSQLSTEEVSDFQKEYSHLWDETTFSKSEEWDSKTPDSQVDVQELPQETTATLTEDTKTVPQPKPRFAKEPPLQFKDREPKLEKQISPVRDDLLDEEDSAVPETYSDKKKFWENVTKEKRMSLNEVTTPDKEFLKKRVSVHEVPVPKPRSQVQVSQSIDETGPTKEAEEPETRIMSEYQASFQPPSERKSKTPPKLESDKESSTDSESDIHHSGTNENAGYISDSGDVEHYISDSEIEDRVPQIRERQMSVFAPPVAAVRKTIYERSASLPTEDLYEVSARSIKLRKQYYEEQIKKEMIEEQLTSELEEEPSPERKTLISSLVQQLSEEKITVRDIARSFDEATKKEVSFEDDRQTHIEDQTAISTQIHETHKEIDVDSQTKRSSVGSEQSSSSDVDKMTRNESTSKPDSMEVHVDKSEIEDSEKLAELDQDATDLETKSLDSLNAVEMSPKSTYSADEAIPEITVTLSGKQRRISEESDEYAPKTEKKTDLDSPIHVPEEHVEDTVWEVSVQSQPEARFDEKVTSFDAATVEKFEKEEDLSLSTRDESDLGSEIHQDHSDSYASDKIKSESHSDIERIILDSLHQQKVDPVEAKAIASALIEEIEAEIQRRESLPPSAATGDVSNYLKYLAETKGLDEREVELVESVLARRQRELAKLSRGDTQASSIEITDEDLRYSGAEIDSTHLLEQQISQLKAEKFDDIKSMTFMDKIDEKHSEESHQSKDFETVEDGVVTGVKSDFHTKSFESVKGEKCETRDTIFEEDETISESGSQETQHVEAKVEAVATETLRKKTEEKEVDEYRASSIDVAKEKTSDVSTKKTEIDSDDSFKQKIEDTVATSDVTKSITKHHIDVHEKSPTEEVKLKGEITCEDYLSKEERSKREATSEIKEIDGGTIEKEVAIEESHIKTIQKEFIDRETEEVRSDDTTTKQTKISSRIVSTDVVHESSSSSETKEQVEIIDLDPSQLPSELGEIKIIEKHEEIKRTSSSESKSSIESGKSPEDQFSTCSSGRKGDSDPSRVTDKSEVLMRKTSSLSKVDRKSGIDFETYSSSGESHYHSFELDSGKSRPCSSDVEGLVAAGSSEYESALTSQDYSCRSHITSTEYHTAVSSLSSKESMKSLDSESSGHLGSVEISELSETLVPSASDVEGDILDTGDQLDDGGWNEELEDELSDKQSKMKRSHEMTFQPEPKLLSTESPQTEESDRKFTSMDDGSVVSMSLSSTSGTTEPRTVIELSRADSERVEGGSMTVSGISDQLSIEGSCDSLIFHQQTPLTTSDMSTSTGQVEGNLQIESITFTTSMVNESGIRSVSTQVTSESHTPEEDRAGKVTEPQPNGKCPPEMKKKCHRRQESTSSFVPPKMGSFEQKYQSELTESDKYTAELSFKEVISDEKKDIDEREKEESYETEADQGFHRDVREGKYQEAEEEIKDDTPEFSSETQASVGELEQEYSSALARAQEVRKKSETSPDLNIHKEPLEKRDSHGKSSSTSSEKSSFEEAEAEAAFNMVAHVSPAHKIKQICPILEDEDAEKHELETRERAQKEYEKRRSQIRDQSPGSIPDIKVTQHMTPLVDRNFRYPDLELEEQERAKEKEKESETQKSTPQTPSSKSSEDTDQGREYVLEDSGISIPEEPKTESKSTVIEQTVKEEADKDTDSPNSDSFEMLEKPDVLDDFVVIEEVGKEAHEFDSEGKSVSIKQKTSKRPKKHDEEVEEYLAHSAPTPLTKMTDVKFYPDGSSSEELGFDFEDSPPINNEASASSYEKELEANKKWIEQQFQGDQAARMAAGYDYEMEFERGPLEDIKEEDINDFDPTSSRIGSLGSQKESGGSLGSVKDSYSSTPDYDVLAGRKYFTRSGEHDDISMSSLQEFENLERAMSLETKRYHQGSQDSSSNGSFKTRYYASKSGQGDDVSVSSLKEFEGLEMACIAAHKVEVKAKEEEAMLAQIDEGQESLASESESCETISRTDKKLIPDSDEEDYEKRMFEIDEIIRQAQSNVERFIDLKEGEKTESLGRGDSIEEVSKVPDLDLDAPVVRSTIKVQWKESEDVMVTSTDSIDGKIGEKGSQHDSTDSLDQKTGADIMTASTDSIEFQSRKTEPINLLSDSIEIRDEACGMVSSDSLELAAKQTENMLESTDSLVDPTSSTATHATYQYETDSVFSGSFTSGGSNTMVSSTDTIDPVQVDIAAAARKVWFDEDTATRRITTEFIQDSSKPYVTEVIEPTDEEGFSHTIHRRVELPPEIRKVTFHGSDADERLRQFIEDFNEGEHVEEVEEVDAAGNVHTKRIVQRRFIVEGPEMEKTVASKTNQLTSIPKETTGEESSFAATGGPKESSLKAQTSRRRQLRYEISVDDQIEVDPREHDWRFNLPEHAEGEESGTSGQQTGRTSQQRSVADQHQLSEEMKQLLKELEKESKQ
ncbi:titin isoform X6 [Tribolium castaneum]|uniref:titin isoform X6 n=1 Tax=Tribolium castaneum TaxID=7070 RepID=UPI0030FE00F3